MPRAKPVPDDEDEKTTIESQWEEEASTTVEQGDVADKIRALGVEPVARQQPRAITNVTNTGQSSLDESTVDDGRRPNLTGLDRPNVARIVIMQGNETGQSLEVTPGKTYTVGRGIDNDLVLTDIAVSRKHFDLRQENGAWVIVDRGSGNGTVVNGSVEDNPFTLANGDTIEIGNTHFRFEHPNAPPRPAPRFLDDEEPSTVAGKPLRGSRPEEPETPVAAQAPPRFERPKTLPPPTPLRARSASSAPLPQPPVALPQPVLPQPVLPQPASTLPMPQMANRPPMSAPQAPTMLGNAMGAPLPPQQMQTTLPGQQMPPRPMFYPQASDLPPNSVGVHAHMVMPQNAGRNDMSTAHVSPVPFGGLAVPQQPRFGRPSISRRTKMAVAGGALALFAAIATAAIIQATTGDKKSDPKAAAKPDEGKPKATVEPITPDGKQPPDLKQVMSGSAQPSVVDPIKEPKTEPKTEPKLEAKTEPKTETRTQPTTEPKTEPKTEEKVEPKIEPKTEAKVEPKTETRTQPKTEPKTETRTQPKTEPKTTAKTETRTQPKTETRTETRRVATIDVDDVKSRADDLYQKRKFSEAASLLYGAAKNASDSDAQKLKYTASIYDKLGRALAVGTAPATKSTDAYKALQQAQNFDGVVGGKFSDEIRTKLGAAAAKATINFMALKDYESAHLAVIIAEKNGSSNDNTRIAKQNLERAAGELYAQASSEMSSDPASAKEKAQRIIRIVDPSSPWVPKAKKLLGK